MAENSTCDSSPETTHPPCNWCSASPLTRNFMFVSPVTSRIICDECVMALMIQLQDVSVLARMPNNATRQ